MAELSPISARERLAAVDVIRAGPCSALAPVAQMPLTAYLGQTVVATFRFGPVEWLRRTLVYGRAQPVRRAAAEARGVA